MGLTLKLEWFGKIDEVLVGTETSDDPGQDRSE
jgi:hypothetical protein